MTDTKLPGLGKSLGARLREPRQSVALGGAEIWKNRMPDEWHLKFPPMANSLLHCPDGNCPSVLHSIGDEYCFVPHCLPVLFRLEKGMKILVLSEYCKREHVGFFTFDHVCDNPEFIQFYGVEPSKDLDFFTPYGRKPLNGFSVSVQWASVRYLAIVESGGKPFGKFGGLDCFKEELSGLAGASRGDIGSAIGRLDALNPMPPKPSLKPFRLSGYIMEDLAKGRKLNKWIRAMETPASDDLDQLAYLFLCLSSRGEFGKFAKKFNGWNPPDPAEFRATLKKMSDWYLGCAPGQGEDAAAWWLEWDWCFKVGRPGL